MIAHPRIVNTDSPTLVALAWGIAATWWVGLPLGCLLAAAARAGWRPKLAARALLRPALVLDRHGRRLDHCGARGYALGGAGVIYILEPLASEIPDYRHALFLGAFSSHLAVRGGTDRRAMAVRVGVPAEGASACIVMRLRFMTEEEIPE